MISREVRPEEATITVQPGERQDFRLDTDGRIVDRRAISVAANTSLTRVELLEINGMGFHVVAGGELAGWALAADGGVRVTGDPVAADARD